MNLIICIFKKGLKICIVKFEKFLIYQDFKEKHKIFKKLKTLFYLLLIC